jgi:hypothetical protein
MLLGGDRVLIAASAPRTADLLDDLGFTPVVVDVSEFEKLEGGVTCLSVLLPGTSAARFTPYSPTQQRPTSAQLTRDVLSHGVGSRELPSGSAAGDLLVLVAERAHAERVHAKLSADAAPDSACQRPTGATAVGLRPATAVRRSPSPRMAARVAPISLQTQAAHAGTILTGPVGSVLPEFVKRVGV